MDSYLSFNQVFGYEVERAGFEPATSGSVLWSSPAALTSELPSLASRIPQAVTQGIPT